MQLRGAVLLVGLLTGVLLAGAVPASLADPAGQPARAREVDSISARLVPRLVTEGEPAVVTGRIRPADAGVVVQIHRLTSPATVFEVRTDQRGRYEAALDTATPGETRYQVIVPGGPESVPMQLTVTANTECSAHPAPVDTEPTGEVHCLLQRLDRWENAGLMGVGQQLNVSSLDAFAPLDVLNEPVAVVGFDIEELAKSGSYEHPFLEQHLDRLLTLADDGAILAATWHAENPFGSRVRLKSLLDETSPAGTRFWADYDEKLDLLRRFQDGDGGRHRPAAVVFRPFHEANGNWFWWGQPRPKVFKALWARLQDRAGEAGVHNLVWAYSANRVTSAAIDPRRLVPRRVDLGGLDSYDPEKGRTNARDRLWLEGYRPLQGVARVPRMALTEVGPHGSRNGTWDPAVISRTVRRAGLRPAWAMLWFDDGSGKDGITGVKQIGSLSGGPAWLSSCAHGLCTVG